MAVILCDGRHPLELESGRPRDMVYFAIFADRWAEVKTALHGRLDRYRATP